jgi:uncharacterized protein
MQNSYTYTNSLINETSPYLLQHAHNPVNWLAWNDESLAKAKAENKPILVSIGYSACHWCHVMEHESFEDTAVAAIMNEHFICIKVDREERPDVDQVYMDAVQLITNGGGWPLNCFAMPDGRPFFGGTYFKRDQWIQVLTKVNAAFTNEPEKVEHYAAQLTEGLAQMDEMPVKPMSKDFSDEVTETAVIRWAKEFDVIEGGPNRAPKFPLPNNYQFLLAFSVVQDQKELLDYVDLTLTKIARGGIYDQIGGGFARYSVDDIWKVPHFEKMLYDNGQLLSVYSQAYTHFKKEEYLNIINETATFVERELTDKTGAFYSALDADSEGEEGKFYVWKEEEFEQLAGENATLLKSYFNVNKKGFWEHGNYILLRDASDAEIANEFEITQKTLSEMVLAFKQKALEKRAERIRPGLDDKSLTSWNALMSKGFVEAYIATNNLHYLSIAKDNLNFLLKQQKKEDGSLWHSYKNGVSSIDGFLEDYAHLCDALIKMYEATFDEKWLNEAVQLFEYIEANFDKNPAGFYYFKSKHDAALVAKKTEINDNVIPASNSIMATCAFKLSLLTSNDAWREISKQMLTQVEASFARYPSGYSQWMLLHQYFSEPFYEAAIVGEDWQTKLTELNAHYLANVVYCGGKNDSHLEVLTGKKVEGKTMIYVCQHGACQQPTENVEEAVRQVLK